MCSLTFTENVALRLLFSSDGKDVRPEMTSTTTLSISARPTTKSLSTEDVEMTNETVTSPSLGDPVSSLSSGTLLGSLEQMNLNDDCNGITSLGKVDSAAEESKATGDVQGCGVPIPWEMDTEMSTTSKEKNYVEEPRHWKVNSDR